MAAGEEKSSDFYAVLGLKKECTATELRNAYKNLALRWHPDRCSASGSSKFIEESKKKFQAIQEAYSVLSDANKRFMYDVGFYDCDDDENGMGDFLNEMAVMMSQNKSNENGETFEELQELFGEMFQSDLDGFGSTSQTLNPSSCSSSSYASCSGTSNANNKRNSFEMNSGNTKSESSSSFDAQFEGFWPVSKFLKSFTNVLNGYNVHGHSLSNFYYNLAEHQENPRRGKGAGGGIARVGNRRRGRKQKVSSGHNVSSSNDYSSISS